MSVAASQIRTIMGLVGNFLTLIIVAVAVFVGLLFHLGHFDDVDKPSVLNLLSKHKEGEVAERMKNYDAKQGYNMDSEDRDVAMVDHYYTLATDFYEYGWGECFHFAHTKVGEDHETAIARHETSLADKLGVKKGETIMDVGCGVGGPAREIAKHTQANIVGITINAYQVERAKNLTSAAGLDKQVTYVQGDFTKMPFKDNTYDRAYAIEATCHAPQLIDVYSEVFRTLKPGGKFATYEWISTPQYDAGNTEHDAILRQIEYGNGLPTLRSFDEVIAAAKEAGFVLEYERDLAQDENNTIPWYDQLELIRTWKAYFTHMICVVTEFLGLSPPGTVDTHHVLLNAAHGLIAGGEQNIFTPMHLFVFVKPAAN